MKQYEVKITPTASGDMYTVISYPEEYGKDGNYVYFPHKYKMNGKLKAGIERLSKQRAADHIKQLEADGYVKYTDQETRKIAELTVEMYASSGKEVNLPKK